MSHTHAQTCTDDHRTQKLWNGWVAMKQEGYDVVVTVDKVPAVECVVVV